MQVRLDGRNGHDALMRVLQVETGFLGGNDPRLHQQDARKAAAYASGDELGDLFVGVSAGRFSLRNGGLRMATARGGARLPFEIYNSEFGELEPPSTRQEHLRVCSRPRAGPRNPAGSEGCEIIMEDTSNDIVVHTADIVSAFVGNSKVSAEALPDLIKSVYGALANIGAPALVAPLEKLVPAVSIKKSITPDFLISLEDGKQYKSLKRHLRTQYGMSPEDYRAKWGLPKDYPMVAPAYAARRSALAKSMGLGRGGAPKAPATAPAKAAPKARAVRTPKA
jgi:predicted transcriptional regulator